MKWYKIKMVYAYWTIYQQLGVVTLGTLSNTILFAIMILVVYVCQKHLFCFPIIGCKVVAWYGLCTCLDFILINAIDLANQDADGDMLKLYNYYERTQNSGFIGLFLTFLVNLALLLLNIFLYYQYLVFVHNDARISDIFMRISGLGRGYYIPDDNEVSWNYLKQMYHLGEINNNRIVVNKIRIPRPYTEQYTIAKAY